jgi:hypothetical protein
MINLKVVAEVMDNLCWQYNAGEFVPLLEADIAGYLYHILLTQKLIGLEHIHLDSRAMGAERNQKFDIILAPIEIREDGRPAVKAQVVIEIKSFPRGFTDQQHRVHLEHVLNDDLPKLSRVPSALKVEVLFDEVSYLKGLYQGMRRVEVIVEKRRTSDANINILLTQTKGDKLVSQLL